MDMGHDMHALNTTASDAVFVRNVKIGFIFPVFLLTLLGASLPWWIRRLTRAIQILAFAVCFTAGTFFSPLSLLFLSLLFLSLLFLSSFSPLSLLFLSSFSPLSLVLSNVVYRVDIGCRFVSYDTGRVGGMGRISKGD